MSKDTIHLFNNVSVKGVIANGSIGSAGQTLSSNGTVAYWSDITGYTGSIGFTGSRGTDGYAGSVGFTGSQGAIGFTGSWGGTAQANVNMNGFSINNANVGAFTTLSSTANASFANVVITGNLVVSGTTTTVNTVNLDVNDAIIRLNRGQPTPLNDIGILMQRFATANSTDYNVGFAWEEGTDRLVFGTTPEDGSDNDLSFSTEWMTIAANGNVGIGNTAPAARLNVTGNSSISSVFNDVGSFNVGIPKGSFTRFYTFVSYQNNGSTGFEVNLTSTGYVHSSDKYIVNMNYDDFAGAVGTVFRLLPIAGTQRRNTAVTGWGSGDFALELEKVDTNTWGLRVRQVGDTDQTGVTGVTFTIRGSYFVGTPVNTTGTDTANYAYNIFRNTPISAGRGFVGINMPNPDVPLQVNGAVRFASNTTGGNWLEFSSTGSNAWRWNTNGVGAVLTIAGNLVTFPQNVRIERQGLTVAQTTERLNAVDINQTWNNAAATFASLLVNATDTASNTNSLLADLQVGGVSQFNVNKNGSVALRNNLILQESSGTNRWIIMNTNGIAQRNTSYYGWGSGASDGGGTPDVTLYRDGAAGILAQRVGTSAQTFRVYGTFTDASNHERIAITANTTGHYIIGEEGGTGLPRSLFLGANNTTHVTITDAGRVGIGRVPSVRLDVSGTGSGGESSIIARGPSVDQNWAGGVSFLSENGTSVSAQIIASTGGLLFSYGASERMRITSAGNLLIGTTTAAGRLTVSAPATTTYGTFDTITDGYGYLTFKWNGTDLGYVGPHALNNGSQMTVASAGANPLTFSSNSVERMRIAANGNIGIGNTTPASRLTILANSMNTFQFTKPDGTNLLRSLWDGSNFHHYIDGNLYYNLANTNFVISGGGSQSANFLSIINGARITVNDAPTGPTDGLIFAGGGSYANSTTTLTSITPLALRTWAWNGTDGFSLSSQSYITQRQLSAANTDAILSISKRHNVSSNDMIRMYIANSNVEIVSGNLGIGTSTPTAKLDVNGRADFGGSAGDALVYLKNAAGNVRGILDVDTSAFAVAASGGSVPLTFGAGGSERARITDTGNFGIGTLTPAGRLDAVGISYLGADTNNSLFVNSNTTVTRVFAAGRSSFSNSELSIGTSNSTSTVEAIRINVDGNVGVGTASPVTKLHVNGGSVRIEHTSDRVIDFIRAGSNTFSIEHDTARMYFYNISTANSVMAFTNASDVGIGTGNPAAKLHVIGGQSIIQNDSAAYSLWKDGTPTKAWQYGLAGGTNHSVFRHYTGTQWNELIRIQDTGNVGIGTNSPGTKLDVQDAANTDVRIYSTPASSKTRLFIRADTTNLSYETDNSNGSHYLFDNSGGVLAKRYVTGASSNWQFHTAGTERVRISNTGNVGIGNTAPAAALHVQGGVLVGGDGAVTYDFKLQRLNATIRAVQHDFAASSNSPWILHGENLSWTGERAGTVESSQAHRPYYEAFAPAVGYKEFGFVNVTSGNFTTTNLISSLTMASNGNIGIGTNSPSVKLDVVGNALFRGGASQTLDIGTTTGVSYIQSYGASLANTPLLFYTGTTERVRIDASGNVGIGNTAPASKLVVTGNVEISTGGLNSVNGAVIISNTGSGSATITISTANSSANGGVGADLLKSRIYSTQDMALVTGQRIFFRGAGGAWSTPFSFSTDSPFNQVAAAGDHVVITTTDARSNSSSNGMLSGILSTYTLNTPIGASANLIAAAYRSVLGETSWTGTSNNAMHYGAWFGSTLVYRVNKTGDIFTAGSLTVTSTLAAGNTTITGFVNATSLSVGSNYVANSTQVTSAVPTLINNNTHLRFQTVNTSSYAYMVQQNDDNFVFYTSNTTYGQRSVWSIFANSITSSLNIDVPFKPSAGLIANNTIGSSGQVLKTNGSTLYWDTAGGTGTVTNIATANGLSGGPITAAGTLGVVTGSTLTVNSAGIHVNSTYVATISANSATYLNSITNFGNSAGITAPAFYDSANTTFVVDPASTTRLKTVNIDNLAWNSIVPIFGQRGTYINELVDVLYQSDKRFTVTNGSEIYFDGNFDSSVIIPVNTTRVININLAGQAGIPANGITYSTGVILVSFYYTSNLYDSLSLRVKNNAGTWTSAAAPINISTDPNYRVMAFTVPIGNYLTDIELTVVTGATNEAWLTSINYYCERWTTELELPYASKYLNSNYFFGNFGVKNNSGVINNLLSGTTNSYLAAAAGNVGIGNTTPNAKLQVTGTANISGNFAIGGITTFGANIVLGSVGVSANGGFGTAGHVLHSNGTATYWASDDGITSLVAANGLSGGTISTTGQLDVVGGSGLVSNSSGVHVGQGNGINVSTDAINVTGGSTLTVNSTGVHVNSTLSLTDLTVTGNLTVSGTTTYINTTNLNVGDNVITLNADLPGATAPTENAGIEVNRGSSANVQFLWDETNDRWSTNGQPLALSSLIASGAASGITTLGAGNTTISGFVNAGGALSVTGTTGLPAQVSGSPVFTGNLGSPNIGKLYIGDGTGWRYFISSRTGSTDTDRITLHDNGNVAFTAAVGGITTLAAGNTTITGFVTASVSVNSAAFTVGGTTVANATGVYATQLNGQLASFYTNATNISTGTLPYGQIPANIVNTTASFTYSGIQTYNANVVIGATGEIIINGAAGISANGTFGTAGMMLTTNGSAAYWSTPITGVTAGAGLTGGGTSGSLTVAVGAGTGIVVNADDIAVNASYIATISANNASFLQTRTWEAPGTIGSTTANTGAFTTMTVNSGAVYRSDWIAGLQSISDFVNGTLVTTDIPANITDGDSFLIEITGKSYDGSNPPFKVIAQGYLYNNAIIAFSGISYGGVFASYIKIFEDGGVLKFWWPRITYWNSFNVLVRTFNAATNGTITRNRITSITDVVEPTGTKKVQVNLATYMRADITATNAAEVRATLFRDSVDTAYYLDPGNTGTSMVVAGNVSIGTTSSSARLHVSGSTRIEHAGDRVIDFIRSGANSFSIEHDTSRMYFYNLSTANNILTFTNESNIGVGTAFPTNKFQVNYGNPVSVPSAGAAGHCTAFGTVGYGLATGALTNGNAYLQATRWDGTATNYNLLLQPNGGNVGIGTTSVTGKLDIVGGATQRKIQLSGSAFTDVVADLLISRTGTSNTNLAQAPSIQFGNATDASGIILQGSSDFQIFTNNAGAGWNERLRLTNAGDVGIGTTTPRGTLSLGTSLATATTQTLHFGYTPADFYGYRLNSTNTPSSTAAGTFAIQRGNTTAWTTELLINDTGNVGVGTTSPTLKFVVSNRGAAGLELDPTAVASSPLIQSYNRSGAAYTQLTFDALEFVWRPSGTERMRLNQSGNLSFGSQTRQMLNLWSNNYGIGVQSSTTYFRSDTRFSWFRGGVHSDTENAPGTGGTVAMTLDSSSNLIVTGEVRGTLFRDVANTSFFVDPGSTSTLRSTVSINEGVSSTTLNATTAILRTGFSGSADYRHSIVTRHNSAANTNNAWDFYLWRPEVAISAEATHRAFTIDGDLGTVSTIASRAPIFYDSVSSGYYLDPNSTSVLNIVRADQIQFSSGNAATVLNNTSYHIHYDPAGRPAIYMGGADPGNYYDNTTHYFRNRTPANQFLIYGNTARRGEYDSSNGRLLIYADSGGWAMGTYFIGSTGTNRGGFGALGSGNDLSTFWIGTEYNSPAVNIFADGRVVAIGSHRAPIFYPDTGTSFYLDLDSTGTSLNVAGAIVAAGNITAYSDIRVKNNITVISDAINKLDKISGITYTRTDLKDKERRFAGVIAQEIEEVLPEAVFGDDNTKTVDYNATIALLIQAVKEQQVLINKLEEKVNKLENK